MSLRIGARPRVLAALTLLSAVMTVTLVPISPAYADGIHGKVKFVEVFPDGQLAFRVYLAGNPTICNSGSNFAYINASESNYASYVALLATAFSNQNDVDLYTTNIQGFCHINSIAVFSY